MLDIKKYKKIKLLVKNKENNTKLKKTTRSRHGSQTQRVIIHSKKKNKNKHIRFIY